MTNYAVGVDIGGSHISCALIDMRTGLIESDSYSTQPVDNKQSAEVILEAWGSALSKTLSYAQGHRVLGIGFAMPGPFDYTKGIALFERVEKYENLYNVNVASELRAMLGLQPDVHIRFMNDATAFAVGEAWIGKLSGYARSVALTLGTGFGSAFIANGIPVLQGSNVPDMGCLWHLLFLDGIADDYFSTRWFIRTYQQKTGTTLSGVKGIAQVAASGDEAALECFRENGSNLGGFLAPWLARFGAEGLVVGGNIVGAYDLWGPTFESKLSEAGLKVNIHLSELMEDAAIIGSARLIDDEFWTSMEPLVGLM